MTNFHFSFLKLIFREGGLLEFDFSGRLGWYCLSSLMMLNCVLYFGSIPLTICGFLYLKLMGVMVD